LLSTTTPDKRIITTFFLDTFDGLALFSPGGPVRLFCPASKKKNETRKKKKC
jgi:hypothetical protein